MQMPSCYEVHFMIDYFMQFVVHVAGSIDMDTRSYQRNHHKHQQRQRIDVPADCQLKGSHLEKRVPIAGVRDRYVRACTVRIRRIGRVVQIVRVFWLISCSVGIVCRMNGFTCILTSGRLMIGDTGGIHDGRAGIACGDKSLSVEIRFG